MEHSEHPSDGLHETPLNGVTLSQNRTINRRTFFRIVGAAGIASLPGCSDPTLTRNAAISGSVQERLPRDPDCYKSIDGLKSVETKEGNNPAAVFAGVIHSRHADRSRFYYQCFVGYGYVVDGRVVVKQLEFGQHTDRISALMATDQMLSAFIEQKQPPSEFFKTMKIPTPSPQQGRDRAAPIEIIQIDQDKWTKHLQEVQKAADGASGNDPAHQ